ncbi:MAG: hypothetical protein KKG00_10035, partial [Bacteroidetes bacterium]|nr:hypothetical protein [Bacteroidota bacterium]
MPEVQLANRQSFTIGLFTYIVETEENCVLKLPHVFRCAGIRALAYSTLLSGFLRAFCSRRGGTS